MVGGGGGGGLVKMVFRARLVPFHPAPIIKLYGSLKVMRAKHMQISQKQSQTWLQVVLHGKCDLMKLIRYSRGKTV